MSIGCITNEFLLRNLEHNVMAN